MGGGRGSGVRRLLSAVNELLRLWFPGFYRKVLRSAHTGVAPPRSRSVGASRVKRRGGPASKAGAVLPSQHVGKDRCLFEKSVQIS